LINSQDKNKPILEDRPCPVCGSTDQSRVFAESNIDRDALDEYAFASRKLPEYMHHRLVECPTCGLLYGSPIPGEAYLAVSYKDAAFDSGEEARCASVTYGRFLPGLAARLPDLFGALDIGTGDGAFLAQLIGHNFTGVAGVEPSSAPILAASPAVKPLIKQGMFDARDYQAGHFSLVSCFQTLEHLRDPMAMCREAYSLLKPGGAVFFIGHNAESVSARLLGRRSPIFDVEHLQLYSPGSARYMLEQCGFRDIAISPVINNYPLHYLWKLFPAPPAVKLPVLKWLKTSAAGRLPVAIPLGNLAMIGFKPYRTVGSAG